MKNYLAALGLSLASFTATGQELHCATEVAMKKVYDRYPELKLKKQRQNQQLLLQAGRTATVAATYVVPVVFHIMHLDGPENISDAQAKDALRILNRDFAKQNPDTVEIIPAFKNLADSAKVQFALATVDPSGNCTNGIVHHYSTDTDWDENSLTLFSYTWDPTKYMNVYVVRSITLLNGFPAAGYTYYPGTWPTGDNFDAIVVLNNYIGSIGTGSGFLSRVLTHETGHWLDLAHVFGYFQTAGIDCTDDDFVSDTPPTIGHLVCPDPNIPSQYQTCTPGISENFQNYMDYSYCCRMFTQGQCQRMQTALQNPTSGRNNLWTNANLLATGVINPMTTCLPIADFKYNRKKTCAGTPVIFTDASWNGTATGHNWSFSGGTPATSTFSAPVVTYANPGVYSVTYIATNAAGSSAPVSKTNIITVTASSAQYVLNWTEGFESPAVFTNDWSVASSSGSGQWERTNTAAATGQFSARISRLYNTRKNVSFMAGPGLNLNSVANPVLSFKVAAAESVPNHLNTLKVFASTDCGDTWNLIYNKVSPVLITSTTTIQDFVPAGPNDWRTESISLASITPAANVSFKFEYVRDTIASANNVYIDDINIVSAPTALQERHSLLQDLRLFPNPSKGQVNVSFNLMSGQTLRFTLSDLLGRELNLLAEKRFEAGSTVQALDVKDLPPGIYLLKTEMNGVSQTRKLLIE